MNHLLRTAVEAEHAQFLSVVAGLPVTARASGFASTVFETSGIVVHPSDDRRSADVVFVRIKSRLDLYEARR